MKFIKFFLLLLIANASLHASETASHLGFSILKFGGGIVLDVTKTIARQVAIVGLLGAGSYYGINY
jgi:hypothetical protein